ncbi:NPCBM/NEW2 domain-containing protein [Micrococcaceae bacterium Sec5.7]
MTYLDDSNFRLKADPTGKFTDPANTDQGDPARTANTVVGKDKFAGAAPVVTEGDWLVLKTAKVSLEINKATTQFRLLRADGSLVFAESAPITFGSRSATQHLQHQDGEQFIGGGMQNGRSVHTGALINIARNFDWDDDGYPNAVPYYMSSNGYGVLRDTFARGSYDFGGQSTTTHEEKRFDAYYFVGDYKQSLNAYTTLTGRPLMPPVYALEYGDADCYNRSNPGYSSSGYGDPDGAKQKTPDAIKTAQKFVDNDMPAGWMLVNDGYGCEYQQLPETVSNIGEQTDLKVGLWTQRSLTNQEYEVGEAGVRMRKLDVAWVGQGYRQALTGCQAAHDGIEQYSDARGTALMVEGWVGAQRCGMQWTGDHAGNLDAIRWQVSALTGAGNSGFAFTTGDVDGIFGGSAESYVRDLQWKAFAPALYSMSGWAPTDKRPWLYGAEATTINRQYLQLRQQLMPFIYSLAQESSATGVSMMRSMTIEFPDQDWSYGAEANNQFMLGSDFLVAPVFTQTDVRNGIFPPAGQQWVDYWTGKVYQGGQILDGYNAPLDKLPIFVRAGAVVPQGSVARNASLVPEDSPIRRRHHRLVLRRRQQRHRLCQDGTDRFGQIGSRLAATVAGGASVTATFAVIPGASAKAGQQTVRISASYESAVGRAQTLAGANQIYVAYGSLAAAYNTVSVTTVANKVVGNFDGGGATFSAEQLATATLPAGGVTPGSTVTVNAGTPKQVDFTWPAAGPDVPNSVVLPAQTISVTGTGTHLAVLGSAAVGNGISPTLTLTYKDGSTEQQSIFFPNWLQPKVLNGATLAVSEQGRNNANGPSPEYTQYKYQAFANTVRLNPTKELSSVTLPTETRVKFFDWKVTTQPLPEVPHGSVYASETPWAQAVNGYGVIGLNVANKDTAGSRDKPLAVNYTDPATGQQPSFAKGLGVHAASKITYYLGGKCSSFTSQVGLESGFGGTIIFKVNADGVNKYQSRTYTPGFAPESVNVDLTGVAYVELVVDPSGGISGAHGVWGEAKFTCAS